MLLSTAYLPPIYYVALLCKNNSARIEIWEHYIKQSYRNRTRILSANGPLDLIIPLEKPQGCKTLIKDVKLSYNDRWNAEHWNAITSAYNSSPFWEYYADDFERFFRHQFNYLIDFNTELLECILNLLQIKCRISYTENFTPLQTLSNDFRYDISPKKPVNNMIFNSYTQVFDNKFGFTPNLSILDILCNMGPETKEYLKLLEF